MLRFSLWEDLPYFHRVAVTGSLRQASKDLKVSPATLSRRIKNLESAMGTPLFFRGASQTMEMTKAGKELFLRSARIDRIVQELETTDEQAPIEIAITSIPCFASHILLPALPRFQASHSQRVNVTIDTGSDVSELARHPFDIALRLSRPETGRFRVQRLEEIGFSVVCGKNFQRPLGPIPLVLWGDISLRTSRFNQWLIELFPHHEPAVYVSSYHMYVEALKGSLGLGILPTYASRAWGGEIVEYTDCDSALPELGLWLVTREDSLHQPMVRMLATFISNLSTSLEKGNTLSDLPQITPAA